VDVAHLGKIRVQYVLIKNPQKYQHSLDLGFVVRMVLKAISER